MTVSPADFGLDHESWRPHQLDSIDWCIDAKGYNVVEAPTGSGKTSFCKATSSERSVIALCRTKNLQAENYGDEYGAAVLFGRANYNCIHRDASHGTTCAECLHSDQGMHKCDYYANCEYVLARNFAKSSPFAALNYAYYLTARWPREEGADVLFLDEAHQLSDIVLDFAGCTITQKHQRDYDLPTFPEIIPSAGLLIKMSNPVQEALAWLEICQRSIRWHYKQAKRSRDRKRLARCENFGRKITATVDALEHSPEDWYIKSGRMAKQYRGQYQPRFIARPLTARHHFKSYFDNDTTIAMSATIGDPKAFCDELGLNGNARFRAVENQFPADMRKVHILDVPGMGRKATPSDFDKQADEISKAILGCPGDWSGLVLVTRKKEALLLKNRLAAKGLGDRAWVTPGWDGEKHPTDEQVHAWNRRKAQVPNSICVTWALWEGYNGVDEKICVVAKTPYPFLGDDYERKRWIIPSRYFHRGRRIS